MFALHFLLCNLVITILLGLILSVKKIFKKHLTISSQYHLWYIFVHFALNFNFYLIYLYYFTNYFFPLYAHFALFFRIIFKLFRHFVYQQW